MTQLKLFLFLLVFMHFIEMGESDDLVSSSSDPRDSLAKPDYDGSRFSNPKSFKNWGGIPGPRSIFKWKAFETDKEEVPKDTKILDESIPVKRLDHFAKPSEGNGDLYASWLGHATMLVHLEGINLITDPVWAERASFLSFMGPKRYRPPPMKIEDLPEIHIGVISHDHYDHLDEEAVKQITENNPNIQWFVPMNMGKWLESVGIANTKENPNKVTEMNWADVKEVSVNNKTYTVRSIPAQHWGQRGAFDRNQRLWSGWIVCGEKKRFLYTGDTGFCDDEYKKVGAQFGPFDLAAIPIGAYEPRWFMKSQHINPEEAVSIHEFIKSKFSIGIHWGTYHMGSYEYYLEPKQKLEEIMATKDLPPFITINMGEIWREQEDESIKL